MEILLSRLPGADPSTDCSLRSTRCSGVLLVGLLVTPASCTIGDTLLRMLSIDCRCSMQVWQDLLAGCGTAQALQMRQRGC